MVTISKLFLAAQHHFVLIIVLLLAILLLGQHFFTTNLNHARVFLQIWGHRNFQLQITYVHHKIGGTSVTLPAGCRRFQCLQALLGT
jgi:hypothetical protein